MPVTANGDYRPRSTAEWLDFLRGRFNSICQDLGKAPPRWERHEFVNMVVTIVALGLSEVDEGVSGVQDVRSVINATGAFLRELALFLGIQIDDGTPSVVDLTVEAWDLGDVTLSAGARAQGGGDDGNAIWKTVEDVVIPAGSTATVRAECVEVGPTTALGSTITRRLDGDAGWVSVTNADPATPGTDAEDDGQIRARILDGSYAAGSRSGLAMKDALENVPGVQKAIVVFNTSMTDQTISSRTVPAGGMTIWLWPQAINDDARRQAAAVIYSMKDGSSAIGVPGVTGADGVRATLVGADDREKIVGYYWVNELSLQIQITVTDYEEGYSDPAQVRDAARAVVLEYVSGLTPGDTIRQQDLAGLVSRDTPGIGRATVELNLDGDGFDELDRAIDQADIPVLDSGFGDGTGIEVA